MDAIYRREEIMIERAYEDWKDSPERYGEPREIRPVPTKDDREPVAKYPTLPNWHLHVCYKNHNWFEIPCVNPACGKLLVRSVECPECGHHTEHYLPDRQIQTELHSPFDAESAAAAAK